MTTTQTAYIKGFAFALLVAGGVWLHADALGSRRSHLDAISLEASALRAHGYHEPLRQLVRQLQEDARPFETALPMQDEVASVLQDLSHDLNDVSVVDRSVTTGTPSVAGTIQRIPMTVAFKGSFADLFEMLNRVNRYERIMRIVRLAVARDDVQSADAMTISATIETYARTATEVR